MFPRLYDAVLRRLITTMTTMTMMITTTAMTKTLIPPATPASKFSMVGWIGDTVTDSVPGELGDVVTAHSGTLKDEM